MRTESRKAINPKILSLAREGRNLSQAQLAELVGLTKGAISQFETRESDPSFSTFAKLVKALGLAHVPVGEFFDKNFFEKIV